MSRGFHVGFLGLLLAGLWNGAHAGASIVVTEPNGSGDKVAEGRDFATYELGNPWDMSDAADVVVSESLGLTNESISGGMYTATSTNSDPQFYLLFQGVTSSYLGLDNGQLHPVDTSRYRFLSMKIRVTPVMTGAFSETFVQAFYYPDENAIAQGNLGQTNLFKVFAGQWRVITMDLENQSISAKTWDDFPLIRGIRIDPGTVPNAFIEVDWVRLHAPGAETGSSFNVDWSGGSGPYTVEAVDAGGIRAPLATGVNTTQAQVDTAKLPPGSYTVEVSNSSGTTASPGPLTVNQAPIFGFLQPDRRGDEANRYSIANTDGSWASIEATDIDASGSINLDNVSYNDPPGALRAQGLPGDGVTGDPGVLMNTPVEIDTERYRLVCYEIEVDGERNIGTGSVARLLYGNNLAGGLSATEDIIVQEGRNEYCIGDMREIPLEGGLAGNWFGSLRYLRMDPYEFDTPRIFRYYSALLAPFDTALGTFDFVWSVINPDDTAQANLYLDLDTIPGNGNDILIGENVDTSSGMFTWNVNVAEDLYYVYAELDDGFNTVTRYAEERLQVGAGSAIVVEVTQPDGLNDQVPTGDDFPETDLGNPWDMSDSADIDLTSNVTGPAFSGGVFSGTAANNDPALFLLSPLTSSTAIDTSRYRYLTAKVRLTGGAEPHFMNAIFYTGNNTSSFGFTSGVVVPGGDWQIITIDLQNQVAGSSPITWLGAGMATGIRLDPTASANTFIEVDWVRLTAPDDGSSTYTVEWTEENLTGSVYDVRLLDPDGAVVRLANDLPSTQFALDVDMSFYAPGNYDFEVEAQPGPTSRSAGSLTVGGSSDGDVIFESGFEAGE